jgi:hypothetical protein
VRREWGSSEIKRAVRKSATVSANTGQGTMDNGAGYGSVVQDIGISAVDRVSTKPSSDDSIIRRCRMIGHFIL